MRTLTVIVNYRTAGMVEDCLRSLAAEVQPDVDRVAITDNDSGDGSAQRLTAFVREQGFGDWATVVPLPRNGGFAYGNNAAIRPALASNDPPRYVWLLNPDTVVRAGALQALIDFLEEHPQVGIAGSRLEHEDGEPQRSAFRFPSFWSEFEQGLRLGLVSRLLRHRIVAPPPPTQAQPTDWVAGASMMVRRDVFQTIGLLDERYFMYYEELDFCRKAAEAGWACWYVPQSRVVHLVGRSSGVTDVRQVKRLPAYWFEARRHYFRTHHGRLGAAAIELGWIGGRLGWRAINLVRRKPAADPPHVIRDHIRLSLFGSGTTR